MTLTTAQFLLTIALSGYFGLLIGYTWGVISGSQKRG